MSADFPKMRKESNYRSVISFLLFKWCGTAEASQKMGGGSYYAWNIGNEKARTTGTTIGRLRSSVEWRRCFDSQKFIASFRDLSAIMYPLIRDKKLRKNRKSTRWKRSEWSEGCLTGRNVATVSRCQLHRLHKSRRAVRKALLRQIAGSSFSEWKNFEEEKRDLTPHSSHFRPLHGQIGRIRRATNDPSFFF